MKVIRHEAIANEIDLLINVICFDQIFLTRRGRLFLFKPGFQIFSKQMKESFIVVVITKYFLAIVSPIIVVIETVFCKNFYLILSGHRIYFISPGKKRLKCFVLQTFN